MTIDRRFRSTVPFYVQARLRYPPELLAAVGRLLGLDGRGRLLDLGCGPGFLAIGLADHFAEVVGMDPEPDMVAAARAAGQAAGVEVHWVLGSSGDLGPHLGRFRVVTMGRSFHWMDREETLQALDVLVEPDGAVCLFGDRHPDRPENAWCRAWEELRHRYGERRPGGDRESHEVVLRRSPFPVVRRIGHVYCRQTSIDEIVTRTLSMSTTSPAVLGPARPAFEAELRGALAAAAVDGLLPEVIEAEALVATRS